MLSLGIAHKWPLLSLTRICENGKLKMENYSLHSLNSLTSRVIKKIPKSRKGKEGQKEHKK